MPEVCCCGWYLLPSFGQLCSRTPWCWGLQDPWGSRGRARGTWGGWSLPPNPLGAVAAERGQSWKDWDRHGGERAEPPTPHSRRPWGAMGMGDVQPPLPAPHPATAWDQLGSEEIRTEHGWADGQGLPQSMGRSLFPLSLTPPARGGARPGAGAAGTPWKRSLVSQHQKGPRVPGQAL